MDHGQLGVGRASGAVPLLHPGQGELVAPQTRDYAAHGQPPQLIELSVLSWLPSGRVSGIEPAWPAWQAGAIPLSYTREGAEGSSGIPFPGVASRPMQFTQDSHEAVATGAITVTFRFWKRPHAKVGGRYTVGRVVIEVDHSELPPYHATPQPAVQTAAAPAAPGPAPPPGRAPQLRPRLSSHAARGGPAQFGDAAGEGRLPPQGPSHGPRVAGGPPRARLGLARVSKNVAPAAGWASIH